MANIIRPKTLLYIIVGIAIFIALIIFNYSRTQKNLSQTNPSPFSLELISYPEKIKSGGTGTFVWNVDVSPDLSTSFTTIYWGYESSPSALMVKDSPDAVRYQYSQIDYATGAFRLPDTFDVNVKFDKPGRVWFRGYAKVNNNHLWSEEKFLDVEQ